jgi:hypothetical protein
MSLVVPLTANAVNGISLVGWMSTGQLSRGLARTRRRRILGRRHELDLFGISNGETKLDPSGISNAETKLDGSGHFERRDIARQRWHLGQRDPRDPGETWSTRRVARSSIA